MPKSRRFDASWDEIYTADAVRPQRRLHDDEPPVYQAKRRSRCRIIWMWQAELTPFDTDRAIATSIVDAVDDTGYLTVSSTKFAKAWAM